MTPSGMDVVAAIIADFRKVSPPSPFPQKFILARIYRLKRSSGIIYPEKSGIRVNLGNELDFFWIFSTIVPSAIVSSRYSKE